jgi:hypothetical protein
MFINKNEVIVNSAWFARDFSRIKAAAVFHISFPHKEADIKFYTLEGSHEKERYSDVDITLDGL